MTSKDRFLDSFKLPALFIIIIWFIHLVQVVLMTSFGWLGLYPRAIQGLKGILFAPLIHGDFGHLISNSIPFFVSSVIIMFFYRRIAIPSFALIYILTGAAVWIFGRDVFHIGASGVVYGLVSFIFWMGIFRRNIKSIALALIVLFLYSGMFMGVLPNQPGVSWESHLFGAIVGIFISFIFREAKEDDDTPNDSDQDPGVLEEEFFLERDTFIDKEEKPENETWSDMLPDWNSSKTWNDEN